ncbi:CzcA family heavy metal efflux pump [Kribbella sp. VKM Ac-2527]|uniref:CzcA family heavy metal efflux pump n=2 Tax=Kribbella caucasensis TaxID=2512215 RepID=A0A4R6KA53_9ACTN|nr:CzcA family heavy metal efflux pump [Kribbella sp. VKM Ac-2527]
MRWTVRSSLRFRHLVVVAASLMMFFGVLQVRAMPLDVFPEFAPPKVEVQTLCLGMSATDVESLITVPLEQALNGVEGLDVMRSRSVSQLSSIQMIFKPGTDLMRARLAVQERIQLVSPTLPRWANSPFLIQPLSSTSRVMKIGLSTADRSEQSLIEMSLAAYWTIRPRLMRVPGVANVAIWGDRWSVLQVQADPDRLHANGVSLNNVMNATADAVDVGMLKFRSGHEIGTGGFIDTPNQRLSIKNIMPLLTPEELAKMPLDVPKGSEPLAIGDVADVVRGHQPMLNGEAVIDDGLGLMLIVEKLPWGNTLEVTRGVEVALAEMAPGMTGVKVDTEIFRPATFIEESIENLGQAMVLGFILVAMILLLFLFEWRVALISIVTIPLSLIAAAMVLNAMGATVNTMILAGMVIALGVLVDDAIIDIENIVRRIRQHRKEGSTRSMAAIVLEASLEVRGPIVHATLIILVSTAPVFLLTGLTGAFFRPLVLAYGLAILASLLVALTVTPALALMLLSKTAIERREAPVVRWLQRGYVGMLERIVKRPRRAYATVGVMLLVGLITLPFLGQSLFPAFKERDFLMHWVALPGTSHPEMIRITTQASNELRSIPGVRNFGAHIGQGTLADEPVGMNFAENWISIDPDADYDKTVAAVQRVVDGYPGLQRDVQTYLKERTKEVLTGTSEAIVVRVYGDDFGVLRAKAQEVLKIISDVDHTVEEKVDLQLDIPQMEVNVNLAVASRYGIKPGDVRRAAAAFIASEEAGDIWRDGKNHEVHVWSTPKNRVSPHAVRNLLLDAPDGRRVSLGELADVRIVPTPNLVLRESGTRKIDIATNVEGSDLGTVAREIERRLAEVEFPSGYHAEILGEFQEAQAAQNRLLLFAGAAVIGMLLILQQAFGSLRLAMLVMLTLPMALVGGVLAALATGGILYLGSLIGFFTVLGIAARNGILMVNHCQHLERHEGEEFGPALVLRGAKERLSPILMTSLATGLALVPLVVAGTIPGHEIEHPMAVVILGGLVTSTLLNLFVVPSLYLRFGRGRSAAPPATASS